MLITKKSGLSGKEHSREIDVTQEQLDRWHAGEYIQDVMTHVSPEDREFLMTGITPEEWKKVFGDAGEE
jgi:hypothetical protein